MATEKKSKDEVTAASEAQVSAASEAKVVSPSDHPGVGEAIPKAEEKAETPLPPPPIKAEKPKKLVQVQQVGAYWFGYDKSGKLLMRSRSEATVRKAVKDFGG